MKKLILAALVSLCSCAVIHAQDIPERKHDEGMNPMASRHGMHHKMDFSSLNLTAEQKEKIKTLNQSNHEKMSELKKLDNITVKESRERMMAIRKEQREKFQSILTPEQKTQLQKNREEQKAKMETMMKARREKMKAALKLTPEQSASMENNRKETADRMQALRDNKNLSDEERRQQIQNLMKKRHENMRSILTDEQKQILKERKKQAPGNKENIQKQPGSR